VELVGFLAGTEHDIEIRDMHDPAVAAAAVGYGIRRVPAVVIDGQLADDCAERGADEETLTQAIFGTGARSDARPRSPIPAAVLDRRADPGTPRAADDRVSVQVEVALAVMLSLALWAVICYAVAALVSALAR
jgi:glutaredoxin 3